MCAGACTHTLKELKNKQKGQTLDQGIRSQPKGVLNSKSKAISTTVNIIAMDYGLADKMRSWENSEAEFAQQEQPWFPDPSAGKQQSLKKHARVPRPHCRNR